MGLEEKALKVQKQDVNDAIDSYIQAHADQGAAEGQAETEAPEEEVSSPPSKTTERPKRAKPEPVEDDEEDDDEEEEKPKPKKARKEKKPAADDDDDEPKQKTFEVHTASGEAAPKKLKEMQSKIMRKSKFLSSAPEMEFEIWGNQLIGRPREFTSGNLGWYTGGKIETKVAGKKLWVSIGVNVTVMGSKEWK